MATTYSLEEFDEATRDYLVEVRDREGRGTPGVFAPVKNPWPTAGCIVGPIIILVTLMGTLLSNIILDDPSGVALLQTAGLMLGGWMFVAAFRVWMRKGSKRVAGHWVYADPLHLYEAKGEQVRVTPTTDVIEAQYTHNYNNGAYQNSVVRLLMPGNQIVAVTLNHEQRAENIVVFYNYLAWARGPDGGERANLPAATLGGLAKYVAKNDNEPLDGEGNVNLDLVELDVDEVPEEPHREGRALPNIIPYIVLVVAGVACFYVMKSVNVPYRDDEIYRAVTQPPMEPRVLRAYLVDPRNTRHREQVYQHLEGFYAPIITRVKQEGRDTELREGMAAVLEALKREDQPVVSIRVTEAKSPAGKEGEAAERAKTLRTGIADKVIEVFKQWAPPVQPPPGMVFKETPPPVGEQLIAFVEAPEDAKAAHFEITYEFAPDQNGRYKVSWTATIRDKVAPPGEEQQGQPAAGPKVVSLGVFSADAADTVVIAIKEAIAKALVGGQ